ncbi:MAG: tetratricopeptide repeat protein [Deltaproteobacteria bacterium]|nr:tetratricopeptide repeat protein [Deltaproteobacteria bacterium]
MNRITRLSSLFLVTALAACGARDQLVRQVGMLERDVADLHRSQRRLERQIEDVQIQLNLLRRERGDSPAASQPRGHVPKAVPMRGREPAARPDGRSEPLMLTNRDLDTGRGRPAADRLPDVDPDDVGERLAVDHAAARRGLMGGVELADGADPDDGEEQEQEQEQEDPLAREAFDRAYVQYEKRQLAAAIRAFSAFMHEHPKSRLTSEALFLAGSARMTLGRVAKAEQDFLALAEMYPRSPRAAEALLLAGGCQENAGRTREARGTYLQLVESYPRSEQAGEANRRLGRIR